MMGQAAEKYASINAVEGGFIVNIGGTPIVTTSLNKAIKLIRDYVGGAAGEAAE